MSAFRTAARLSAAVALVAACADGTTPTDPTLDAVRALADGQSPTVQRSLAAVRAASARFHRVADAQAAGYVAGSPCVANPAAGGMGVHYVHPQLIADPALDPEKPEVLVYEPQAGGQLRLVAVEYLGAKAMYAQRPSLFGAPFEDGPPVPGANGQATPTYALHAWVWQRNPAGVFAAFNPAVTCAHAAAPTAHAHH
jgi:hypothetical protein